MGYPPLLYYLSENEYRKHFEKVYCRKPIITFDHYPVFFRKNKFKHAFFESSNRDRNKDMFSHKRAERMDWIKATLEDPTAELFEGWDNKKRVYDNFRRVSVVMGNFVVVIHFSLDRSKAFYVTSYVADTPKTLQKIKGGKKWIKKDR